MVYGFGFVPQSATKYGQIPLRQWKQRGSNTGNLHSWLKATILTPLRRCMGQPRYVHHLSLFMEARLLDLPSLSALAAVRLAHRWAANTLDSTDCSERTATPTR